VLILLGIWKNGRI